MRILYICPEFLPKPGGIISHVYNIAKRMKHTYGHSVTVLTLDYYNDYPSEAVIDGLLIKRLHFRSFGGAQWMWSYAVIPKVLQFLRENKFDIVHVHSYTNFGPLAAYLYSKNNSKASQSLIFTPHYHPKSTTLVRNIFRQPYDMIFKRKIFHSFSKVITLTKYERDIISHFCQEDKIEIIPNGIDLYEIEKASAQLFREHYGLNQTYVLYAGYLLRYKGVQVLLEAMRKILSDRSGLKLGIIGDGAYRQDLERFSVKLGIQQDVLFTGFVDRQLLLSALKGCELFVMPSSYEAFSIITIEAMACGKPIVATEVGGLTELGICNELLVRYGDVGRLSGLISYLLDDPQKAQVIGKGNRDIALQRYSWDKIAEALERSYLQPTVRGLVTGTKENEDKY
ncbi:glycosyltransferase family 4 protein [Dehalococcoidia bacterium]|nr:glycosyltransferase family 4 protein [Dehalococcoidia bacterium]